MIDDPRLDDEVLEVLGRGLDQIEPLPDHLRAMAFAAFALADVEDLLADVTFDSLFSEQLVMRGDESEARLLSFSNDFLTLDVSLAADGQTIVGEIQPPARGELRLECRSGEISVVPIDDLGRFRLVSDATSFRLRVTGQLVTPWVTRR